MSAEGKVHRDSSCSCISHVCSANQHFLDVWMELQRDDQELLLNLIVLGYFMCQTVCVLFLWCSWSWSRWNGQTGVMSQPRLGEYFFFFFFCSESIFWCSKNVSRLGWVHITLSAELFFFPLPSFGSQLFTSARFKLVSNLRRCFVMVPECTLTSWKSRSCSRFVSSIHRLVSMNICIFYATAL